MIIRVKEREVLRDVCKWLTDKGIFFWRCNNAPTPRYKKGNLRFMRNQSYTLPGLSDIIVLYKGILYAIEVKGIQKYKSWVRVSPEQKAFCNNVLANGGKYYIVSSIKEVQDIFL